MQYRQKIASDAYIGQIIEQFGSQATFAIGFVNATEGFCLVVSMKGCPKEVFDNVVNMRNRLLPQAKIYDVGSVPSGLHAEMSIVKFCHDVLEIPKTELGARVQIACIGKAVCKDCAGWMNGHSIGHCSLVQEDHQRFINRASGNGRRHLAITAHRRGPRGRQRSQLLSEKPQEYSQGLGF